MRHIDSYTFGSIRIDGFDLDYVMEIFPYPLDILLGEPVACQPGTGVKYRIPVVHALCEE